MTTGTISVGRIVRDALLLAAATLMLVLLSILGAIVVHRFGTSDGRADCAIVFGSAVRVPNQPGPGIVRRVATAVRLYDEGKIRRLILSGGKGSDIQASEAAVMQEQALESGIPASALEVEDQSHSTLENLQNSLPLLEGCSSVIGVSDGYHLARIEMLADRIGLPNLSTYPADQTPNLTFEIKSIAREVAAYAWYSLPVPEQRNAAEIFDIIE